MNKKNLDEVNELVRLAENLRVGILFEPLHEHEDIPDAVWAELGIRDRDRYARAVDRITELKSWENP